MSQLYCNTPPRKNQALATNFWQKVCKLGGTRVIPPHRLRWHGAVRRSSVAEESHWASVDFVKWDYSTSATPPLIMTWKPKLIVGLDKRAIT